MSHVRFWSRAAGVTPSLRLTPPDREVGEHLPGQENHLAAPWDSLRRLYEARHCSNGKEQGAKGEASEEFLSPSTSRQTGIEYWQADKHHEGRPRKRRHKRAGNAQRIERTFESIFEFAPDAMVIVDRQGLIVRVNGQAERMFAYGREELLGRPVELLIPEGLRERHVEHRTAYAADPHPRPMGTGLELHGRLCDGHAFPVEVSLSPLENDGGLLLLGVIRDISERKRVEATLQDSEQRYRSLFDNMLNGFAYCQMVFENGMPYDFVYLTVNRAFETITGLTGVAGKRVSEVIPGIRQSNPELLETCGRVASTGRPESFETYVEPLGIWFSISAYRTEPGYFVAIFENISERKRMEEVLQQSEERFASAFEYASIGIALVAPDGRWLKVNQALCALVGYTAEELLTKTFQDITHPDDLDADLEHVRQMLAGEIQTYQMEKRYFHRSGAVVWVLLSVSLVRDREGQPLYFISLIEDINERKRVEQTILRRNAELSALIQMGQALSRLSEPARLLELIYGLMGQILDNRNLYIALYDETSQSISFPVYTIDGQRIERPARHLSTGLTEHVIRSQAPLFLPRDVVGSARALGIEPQGRPARCFVAVPMIAGDKVMGVIAIQDYEREDAYDRGQREVLGAIAAQAAIALENARLFAETRQRAEQLQAIHDVEQVVRTVLDPELLTAHLAQVIHARLNLPNVAVGLIEGDELVFGAGSAAGAGGLADSELRLKVGAEGITGQVALTGETILVPDVDLDPRFRRADFWPHTRSELAVALKTHASFVGVLNLESDKVNAFTPELVRLVETLGAQIATGIANARLFAETQRLARTDALTGIVNRRHLFELGAQELSRARRFGHPLSALMLDIDHFKHVNDIYGHAAGDQILWILARCFKTLVRDSDIVARYGGEEFVILLVETDLMGAHAQAERLREQVAGTVTVSDQGPLSVTISLGISAALVESDELATLLARADGALYRAKQAGRNRVEVG